MSIIEFTTSTNLCIEWQQSVRMHFPAWWINYSFMSRSLEYGDDDLRDQHFILHELLTKCVYVTACAVNSKPACLCSPKWTKLCALSLLSCVCMFVFLQAIYIFSINKNKINYSICAHYIVFGWNEMQHMFVHFTNTFINFKYSTNALAQHTGKRVCIHAITHIQGNCVHSSSLKITLKLMWMF